MSKKCISCNIVKDITDFHKYKRSSDGIRARCKDCRKEHYISNADKERARVRKYYSKNSEKVKNSRSLNHWGKADVINILMCIIRPRHLAFVRIGAVFLFVYLIKTRL